MTMANALELRVPFLDHKVVEFAAQLPQDMKLRGGTGKVLLRKAMKDVLPASILHRPKKGFPVPTMGWLRGPLKEFTRETLLSPGSACHNYFDAQVLREIVDRHEANYLECKAYGADVTLVDGLISDCGRMVAERA